MADAQAARCRKRLEQFLIDLLEPLGRSERRHWGGVYVRGLLLDGERKSIEPMAARLPEGNAQAMQQLVGQSPWEWQEVWTRLGKRMTAELEPDAAWVVDGFAHPVWPLLITRFGPTLASKVYPKLPGIGFCRPGGSGAWRRP
jgi:SRSO17 transposase